MDVTASVNDTITISEIRFPVVYVRDAWNYADNQPISFFCVSGIATNQGSSLSELSATQFFVGQSFTGDGRYLGSAMFTSVQNTPTPSTAKLYARLYTHTGTFGSTSTHNTLLETSTNYIQVSELTAGSENNDLVFYFNGTRQLVNGTKYVIGVYSSEISTGSVELLRGGASNTDAAGNMCNESNLGGKTAWGNYDLVYAVNAIGERIGNHFRYSISGVNEEFPYFSRDGLNAYYAESSARLVQYKLSVPWNPQSGVFWGYGPVLAGTYNGIAMSIDGKNIYVIGNDTYLNHYTLTTPYDITTAVYVTYKDLGAGCSGVDISTDGTRLFILSRSNPNTAVLQYNLTTPFSLANLTETAFSGSSINSSSTAGAGVLLYGGTGIQEAIAQSYTPSSSQVFGRISLYVGCVYPLGSPTNVDGIYIEVSTSLGGTVIATSTTAYPVEAESMSAYVFDADLFFPSGLSLTAGQEYFFTIKRTGARSTTIYYGIERSSSTTAGWGKAYSRSSSVWTEYTNSTLTMGLYVDGRIPSNGQFHPFYHVVTSNTEALGYRMLSSSGQTVKGRSAGPIFSPDGKVMAIFSKWRYRSLSTTTYTRCAMYFFTLTTAWDVTSAVTKAVVTVFPLRKESPSGTQNTPMSGYISPGGKYIAFADNTSYFDFLTLDALEQNIYDQQGIQENIPVNNEPGGINANSALTLTSLLTNSDFVEMLTVFDNLTPSENTSFTGNAGDVSVYDTVYETDALHGKGGNYIDLATIYRPRATFGKNEAIHAKITASGGKLVDPRGGQSQYSHNQGGSL